MTPLTLCRGILTRRYLVNSVVTRNFTVYTPILSNKSNGDDDLEAKERLSKILADVPQGNKIISETLEKEILEAINTNELSKPDESALDNSESKQSSSSMPPPPPPPPPSSLPQPDKPTSSTSASYMDIFNIKQIIETVKASENVKQLQRELTTFYENKKKSQQELNESLSTKIDQNVKELKSSIGIASKVVNEITGYNKVIQLKNVIVSNESKLKDLKVKIHKAKIEHEKSLELRSTSQKEVNELLEHKNSWNPIDLERFTKIYMNTHDLDKIVKETSKNLKDLEDLQESTHDALIRSIMNRYHEEQVWSDKIRQFSTWGTIFIMAINLLLVFLVQFIFEPFKRWRLVNSFEEKVKELFHNNEKLDSDIQELKKQLQIINKDLKDELVEKEPNYDESVVDNESVIPVLESSEALEPPSTSELPPFRIIKDRSLDTTVLSIYANHYYNILKYWLMGACQYLTPVSWTNTTSMHTTVGEFQKTVVGSISASLLVGVLLGHLM